MRCPFLIGERVYLRGLELSDLNGNYIAWLNDAQVCQFNSHHVFPYSKEAGESYIKHTQSSKQDLILAIVVKHTDQHIGNIALQCIHPIYRNAEYAILLGEKEYWGQGYSKEASVLLIQHGFLALNLHRIYCGTSADNVAMQKLAIFMGMKEEGRRREAMYKNGKYVDVVEYGMTVEDFFNKYQNLPDPA